MELLIVAAIISALVISGAVILLKSKRQVPQGTALVISKMKGESRVSLNPTIVLPIVHRAESIDITTKAIEVSLHSKDGVSCRDNIRADVKIVFFIRIRSDEMSILKVSKSIGCARASDPQTLETLFLAKFSEAIKTVFKQFDFDQTQDDREMLRDRIIMTIGEDLNGYLLDDIAVDMVIQTPIEHLDPMNILDAQGIKKITAIAADAAAAANDFRSRSELRIAQQNLEVQKELARIKMETAALEAQLKEDIQRAQTDIAAAQIEAGPATEVEASPAKLAHENQSETKGDGDGIEDLTGDHKRIMERMVQQQRAKTQALLKKGQGDDS